MVSFNGQAEMLAHSGGGGPSDLGLTGISVLGFPASPMLPKPGGAIGQKASWHFQSHMPLCMLLLDRMRGLANNTSAQRQNGSQMMGARREGCGYTEKDPERHGFT